jgi:hypothetical protein
MKADERGGLFAYRVRRPQTIAHQQLGDLMTRLSNLVASVLLAFFALTLAAQTASTTAKIDPASVRLTSDPDDVEFCKPLGAVAGKSAWSSTKGQMAAGERAKSQAAAAGGNVLGDEKVTVGAWGTTVSGSAFFCDAEGLKRQAAKSAELERVANQKIACTAGPDCEYKWSRVTLWLSNNSSWKFRNITDTLITTEGPMDTSKPAFEVIKMATGDGRTYQISMRPSCGVGCTEKDFLRLRAKFAEFVLTPPEVK